MQNSITRITNTAKELKRRKVFRVASIYTVSAWGLSMGAAELLPTFGVSDTGVRMLIVALILGLPVAVILAWIYELGPGGVEVDPGPGADDPTVFAGSGAALTISMQKDGKWESRTFNKSFTIGRNPSSDLVINDPSVSRRHARVIRINDDWELEDLGSRNGTRLNGELIDKVPVPAHGEIQLSEDCPRIIIKNHDADMAKTELKPIKSAPAPAAEDKAASSQKPN